MLRRREPRSVWLDGVSAPENEPRQELLTQIWNFDLTDSPAPVSVQFQQPTHLVQRPLAELVVVAVPLAGGVHGNQQENCPGYHRERMPAILEAAEKMEDLAKELNVKVHFVLNAAPEHDFYVLLEADGPFSVARSTRSSDPAARILVSFFSLQGLTTISLSREFSPIIIPS